MKNILLFLTLLTSPLFGVLSPLSQSLLEVRTLLEKSELSHCLGEAEPIEEIIHNQEGYLVRTASKELQVDLIYLEVTRPGPRPFTFQFKGVDQ